MLCIELENTASSNEFAVLTMHGAIRGIMGGAVGSLISVVTVLL